MLVTDSYLRETRALSYRYFMFSNPERRVGKCLAKILSRNVRVQLKDAIF